MQQSYTIDLNKFKSAAFFSGIFKTTGQLCFGFGWESESIALKLGTMFDFQDCYKTMISDLCNWDSTFEGEDAKWFDDCSPSIGSSLVTLKNYILAEAISDMSFFGGTVTDGRGCWQFAEWTEWTPYVAQAGFKVLETLGMSPGEFTVGETLH